jgi:hypothetical protein
MCRGRLLPPFWQLWLLKNTIAMGREKPYKYTLFASATMEGSKPEPASGTRVFVSEKS